MAVMIMVATSCGLMCMVVAMYISAPWPNSRPPWDEVKQPRGTWFGGSLLSRLIDPLVAVAVTDIALLDLAYTSWMESNGVERNPSEVTSEESWVLR